MAAAGGSWKGSAFTPAGGKWSTVYSQSAPGRVSQYDTGGRVGDFVQMELNTGGVTTTGRGRVVRAANGRLTVAFTGGKEGLQQLRGTTRTYPASYFSVVTPR